MKSVACIQEQVSLILKWSFAWVTIEGGFWSRKCSKCVISNSISRFKV